MSSGKWIVFVAAIIIVAQQIHAACLCNEKGSDYCESCADGSAVRPKPKLSEGKLDMDLSPIGDNCWCSRTMIQPASLPKLSNPKPKTLPACVCKRINTAPSILSLPFALPAFKNNYIPSTVRDDSLPADPISINLAIQAGKAIEVPEAKLAYGFVQKPLNGLPKVYVSSIREENLYALKNDVITLKKPAFSAKNKKKEEDYPEPEEEEDADTSSEEEQPPRLTYKQLGYEAEDFKNPKFMELPIPKMGLDLPAALPGKLDVDCGFKPGRIAKYIPVKKPRLHRCNGNDFLVK